MSEMGRFRGTGVALVTPFKEDGTLDLDGCAQHAERMIEGGCEVLVPCGTTGESVTMSPWEQVEVVRTAVQVAGGRALVMAGAGTNNTREAMKLAEAVSEAGADAVLSVSPYYNKPPQEGLFQHFRSVAQAAGIPVFVYNVPGRTSVNILPETALRLAEVPGIAGIKEASGNLEQVGTILARRPEGFLVLSGDDELTLPMLALGADGLISVMANEAPRETSDMVRLGLDGDFARARELHFRLLDLMRANFAETNPVPVKAGVELVGGPKAHYRLPLVPPSEATRTRLLQALKSAGLVDDPREVA